MEHPIKMDDLEVPLFLETPICFILWVSFTIQKHPKDQLHRGLNSGKRTPCWKLTAGTQKWRWMEDDFPFQLGDF